MIPYEYADSLLKSALKSAARRARARILQDFGALFNCPESYS
jgi:hypothetical protein